VGSFVLELAAAHALARGRLGKQAGTRPAIPGDSFLNERLVDPANPDNVVTDDLRELDKLLVTSAAQTACRAPGWEWIVW
jgi:hypothetical protein